MRSAPKVNEFFFLTAVLALPSYLLLGFTARGVIFAPDVAFLLVPLATLAPLLAALVLTGQNRGWSGIKILLWRSVDFQRAARKSWLLVALAVPPVIVFVAWVVAKATGFELISAQAPFTAAIVMFFIFFVPALAEELGWMGYAYEPMERKWHAFKAALILGAVISAFHFPLYYFLIDDPVILAVQMLFPISLRLLVVWIYNNTGKSIFAATVFHASYNTAYTVFEVNIPAATTLSVIFALAAFFLGTRVVGQDDG